MSAWAKCKEEHEDRCSGWEGRVTCGGGVRQVRHAVARALEVSLHAAAVSDSLQGTQAGARGQIRHAVPQLLWNHTHHTTYLTKDNKWSQFWNSKLPYNRFNTL